MAGPSASCRPMHQVAWDRPMLLAGRPEAKKLGLHGSWLDPIKQYRFRSLESLHNYDVLFVALPDAEPSSSLKEVPLYLVTNVQCEWWIDLN